MKVDAAMNSLGLTIPLVKIDEERRLIVARAAQETPDRSREIMDYATAKPAFEKWSQEFERATGGLSKGNIRVMHTKVVAGKVTDLSFNDSEKAVDVVLKVVDDAEWKKCLEGVYTGLSIGGGYANRWDDNGMKRYTPDIREISLVDNPCIPTARFAELVKLNGQVEELELRGVVRGFGDNWQSRPRSFGELVKAAPSGPLTFGDLQKFDESKHKRDRGRFASVGATKPQPGWLSRHTGAVSAVGSALVGGALLHRYRSPLRHFGRGFMDGVKSETVRRGGLGRVEAARSETPASRVKPRFEYGGKMSRMGAEDPPRHGDVKSRFMMEKPKRARLGKASSAGFKMDAPPANFTIRGGVEGDPERRGHTLPATFGRVPTGIGQAGSPAKVATPEEIAGDSERRGRTLPVTRGRVPTGAPGAGPARHDVADHRGDAARRGKTLSGSHGSVPAGSEPERKPSKGVDPNVVQGTGGWPRGKTLGRWSVLKTQNWRRKG